MAAAIGLGLTETSTATRKLVQDRENLYAIEKGVEGISKFFQGKNHPVATGIQNLAGAVGTAEIITCGAGVFTFAKYAWAPKEPKDVPPKFYKDPDGIVKQDPNDIAKRLSKIGKTALAYDMVYKPQKALASFGFLFVSVTSFVRMLEAFAIPVLSSIEKGFGMIPVIGQTIGSGIANHFYAVGGIALVAAHGALVFDSIRYLYLAAADTDKNIWKGVIQLAARVAALALDLFCILHISNPIVMGCAGIGMAALTIASCIYKWQRAAQKEQQQKDLLELAIIQDRKRKEADAPQLAQPALGQQILEKAM